MLEHGDSIACNFLKLSLIVTILRTYASIFKNDPRTRLSALMEFLLACMRKRRREKIKEKKVVHHTKTENSLLLKGGVALIRLLIICISISGDKRARHA